MDLLTLLKVGLTLSCPQTTLIDQSGAGLTPWDWDIVKINQSFCEERLPQSPCLVTVYKRGTRRYYFLCGKKKMLPPKEEK